MTARSAIRNRFARTRSPLRRTPVSHRQSLEALEDRTLLSVDFLPAVSYSGGGDVRSVAVGEFNDDQRPDLVVANRSTANFSVFLGNGDGSFNSGVSYDIGDLGNGPWSVAVGDFNGDGQQDLATASLSTDSVSVVLGNGDGTFQSALISATGDGPFSVVVGDFDRDGRQDLAVAGSSGVSVLLGNGDGTFQRAVTFAAGNNPQSVAVGDFNGDGQQDLAVANAGSASGDSDSVSVLLGDGTGSFSPAANYVVGDGPTSVLAADLNGDHVVSALGNTFEDNGVAITSPYRIKDEIFDALNAGGGGLVSYVAENVYVTRASGSIQRGVDAVAAGGTVNVQDGRYENYDVGSKLLTIAFENGPVLTQRSDSLNSGVRSLVVTGTPGNDKVFFNPGGGPGSTMKVMVNDLPQATFSPDGRLIAYSLAGNDDIEIAGGIKLPAWLSGGDGNDRLNGGGDDNVLVGGAGDDTLIGGRGQNLLIGGSGADAVIAGSGDDLLIAGRTAYDANDAALAASMAEWSSGRSYASRVANLSGTGSGPRNNGNDFLVASGPNATVFDDNSVDVLNGGSGMDWFFANRSGGVAPDIIKGLGSGEIVEELDVQAL
jgi:hypothetical protein